MEHAQPAVVGHRPALPGRGDLAQLVRRRQPYATACSAKADAVARPAHESPHQRRSASEAVAVVDADAVRSRSPAACAQARRRRPASGSARLCRARGGTGPASGPGRRPRGTRWWRRSRRPGRRAARRAGRRGPSRAARRPGRSGAAAPGGRARRRTRRRAARGRRRRPPRTRPRRPRGRPGRGLPQRRLDHVEAQHAPRGDPAGQVDGDRARPQPTSSTSSPARRCGSRYPAEFSAVRQRGTAGRRRRARACRCPCGHGAPVVPHSEPTSQHMGRRCTHTDFCRVHWVERGQRLLLAPVPRPAEPAERRTHVALAVAVHTDTSPACRPSAAHSARSRSAVHTERPGRRGCRSPGPARPGRR